jgi:GTPase SAR1 family protein
VNIGLWEVLQRSDDTRLRPLYYPQTDCFLLCYSVDNRASFESIFTLWIPEITHHCPDTVYLVIGLKSDLRLDAAHVRPLNAAVGCTKIQFEIDF